MCIRDSRYTEAQTLAIAAYVAANGGGPELVYNEDGTLAVEELRGENYDGQIDPCLLYTSRCV